MNRFRNTLAFTILYTQFLWFPLAIASYKAFEGLPMAEHLSGCAVPVGVVLAILPSWAALLFRSRVTHVLIPLACAAYGGPAAMMLDAHSPAIPALSLGAAGTALSAFLWKASPTTPGDPDADPNFVRGSQRESSERAQARCVAATPDGEDTFTFGPLALPRSMVARNFIAVGAPSSGKTLLEYLALKSILRLIEPGSGRRLLIYDAKTETISRLADLGYTGRVVVTSFPDARSSSWQLGADFDEPHLIAEMCEMLFPVPETGHPQVFFDFAVRDLAQGVALSWRHRHPGAMTLRDLINSMESERRLRQVLGWNLDANYTRLELYFSQPDTLKNILATVASKMEPYRALAAFWHHSAHSFSLKDWLESSSVLVLGRPMDAQTAADRVNSLILGRLTQLLIKGENSEEPRTFIFLDEISKAGKLRYLDQLLLQGRSKGVPVWLGAQSISSLQATYGKEVANDLLAGCGNVAVLALADAETARWAEETFGRQERWVSSFGYSHTVTEKGGSTTRSTNWSLSIKPTVLASEFLSLRPPNKHTNEPLAGYFRVPGAAQFRAEIALDKLRAEIPDTTARGTAHDEDPDFIPAPREHGELPRYSADELRILRLPLDGEGLGTPEVAEAPSSVPTRTPKRRPTTPPKGPLDDLPNLFSPKKKSR